MVTEGAVPVPGRRYGQQAELFLRAPHQEGVQVRGLALADLEEEGRTPAQVGCGGWVRCVLRERRGAVNDLVVERKMK